MIRLIPHPRCALRHFPSLSRPLGFALLLLALGSTSAAAEAQSLLSLPKNGAAYKIVRGPSVIVRLALAKDGKGERRLVIDDKTPDCKMSRESIHGGTRFTFACKIEDKVLGKFTLKTEMDVLEIDKRGPYSLTPRVTKVASGVAVTSVGLQVQILDGSRVESLVIPAFSGGEFDEPASSIPLGKPVDLGSSHSMQMTSYYGQDGKGLLLYCEDPQGTKPKRLIFESQRLGRSKAFTIAIEYPMPDAHKGGLERSAPVATRIEPYQFDTQLESGWYRAAKIYRKWLEKNATGRRGILQRGRFEDRKDVPKWCKEIDLFLSEQFGWYPKGSQVKKPLLHLRRLKKELDLDHVLVGLWFSGKRGDPLGRAGSWLPDLGAVTQFHALKKDGIRFAGYTFPGAFDPQNPLYGPLEMYRHTSDDRKGKPRTTFGGFDSLGKPITLNRMDVAASELAQWYRILGMFHSAFSGYSGFYSDLPATVGFPDWKRRPALELGMTESSMLGFRNILDMTRIGAYEAGHEFVQFHEAAFEWLIPAASFGQGAVGTIGRAYKDDTRTRGVPMFQAVYSGYTQFWPADEGFGPQTLLFLPDAYGPVSESNMTRLLAKGFTWGAVLNSSEPWLPTGKLFWEVSGSQAQMEATLHHKKTLKNLVALRDRARKWLAYGEMLANPVIGGDRITVTVKKFFGDVTPVDQSFRMRMVPTTAWKAKDGSIRLVAANGSRKKGTVKISLEGLGFRKAKGLRDTNTKEVFKADKQRRIVVPVRAGTGRLLEIIED